MFDALALIKTLPHLPGVYRMLGVDAQVLYVGKARDLKKRVSSYFHKNDHTPRIQLMLKQVQHIEVTICRSEAEALILEDNLIKSLKPRYNILFRDDKSYPYIKISAHEFPQIASYRGEMARPHQYFGPYANVYAVRQTVELLQKVFRLRTCEDSVFRHRSRPCLQYQINRCTAPCVGLISAEAYRRDVHTALLFLQGKEHVIIEDLTQRMQAAAAAWDFELAAQLRNQIQALARVQEKQFVSSTRSQSDCDVLACVQLEGRFAINLVMIRGGRHVGDKTLFPDRSDQSTEAEVLEAFISQHYLHTACPSLILHHPDLSDTASLSLTEALSELRGHKVVLQHRVQSERRVWLSMAEKNAEQALRRERLTESSQRERHRALQEALDWDEPLQRIECFDISHTMGEATVASCVVFDQMAMQPREYRRFNIQSTDQGDDYAAMREAIHRRYSKLVDPERVDTAAPRPDLLLIDGGLGQVAMAQQVLDDLGLSIPILGIAKGPERKAGAERLIVTWSEKTLQLGPEHPGLQLLQQIRDEAHRFAITGHRQRRAKARQSSRLEDIAGVGAKRRQALILRFGSMKGVRDASIEDLQQVPGIHRALAEKIHQALHQDDHAS